MHRLSLLAATILLASLAAANPSHHKHHEHGDVSLRSGNHFDDHGCGEEQYQCKCHSIFTLQDKKALSNIVVQCVNRAIANEIKHLGHAYQKLGDEELSCVADKVFLEHDFYDDFGEAVDVSHVVHYITEAVKGRNVNDGELHKFLEEVPKCAATHYGRSEAKPFYTCMIQQCEDVLFVESVEPRLDLDQVSLDAIVSFAKAEGHQ